MGSSASIREAIATDFRHAAALLNAFAGDPANLLRIEEVARLIAGVFRAGGKVLACGNGGSCCDAIHFCEEFTGRFRHNRPPLPAIACADPGHLTCTANDFGYENVFSRWVEALAKPGDCLVVLSTSGNSDNIVRAVRAARSRGLVTVALLGKGGGTLKGLADHEWVVPGLTEGDKSAEIFADRIQEIHMLILHALINAVERTLFAGGAQIAEVKAAVPAVR